MLCLLSTTFGGNSLRPATSHNAVVNHTGSSHREEATFNARLRVLDKR